MVSIVIVSHSLELATGVRLLAEQMTQGRVQLAVAAGIDDADNPIGTDSIAIMMAIEEVYNDNGVIVFVDMGSAILSTDMALELLEEDKVANIRVCAAPLIEGVISASVAAANGASIDEVLSEAHSALLSKYQLLNQNDQFVAPIGHDESCNTNITNTIASHNVAEEETLFSIEWQVQNPHGIHARPASAIVACVSPFDANINLQRIHREDGTTALEQANAKSINRIALLGIKLGDTIRLSASGTEASKAVAAFTQLAHNHFNESIEAETGHTQPSAVQSVRDDSSINTTTSHLDATDPNLNEVSAIAASEGIAIAKLWHYHTNAQPSTMPIASQRESLGYEAEWALFNEAIAYSKKNLAALAEQLAQKGAKAESEIFNAHQQMLDDPELIAQISQQLQQATPIDLAWFNVIESMVSAYKNSDSEYMQQRASDIHDVGRQVMQWLLDLFNQHYLETPEVTPSNSAQPKIEFTEAVIIVASDLTPSDTLSLDPKWVKGIVLEQGGRTSHAAILARALGIPAIVGVRNASSLTAQADKLVILDGHQGKLWLTPTSTQIEQAKKQQQDEYQQKMQWQNLALNDAYTKDGKRIEVFANIAYRQDIAKALEQGAEGVGLVRSELFFFDYADNNASSPHSQTMPSEDHQYDFYAEIAAAFAPKSVIIRTLDVGGDKPLAYLQPHHEDNPFLGCRGLRLCLQNPAVFAVQLKALLRVRAKYPNLKIMFPMVSTVEELRQAKAMLYQCHHELQTAGIASEIADIGIMIEVPAAAINAAQLAQEASFFSIGSNDLTQYVMAADRGNEQVSYLISSTQDAVLKMIKMAATAAHDAGIEIGLCGEMAGDPTLTECLIGLGINELSMSPIRIAQVKQVIRNLDAEVAKHKVDTNLQ